MRRAFAVLSAMMFACGGTASPPRSTVAASGAHAVIYLNAVVHTFDPSRPAATGLRIDGGRITHLVDGDPPADLTGRRVDLRGATVLPGLVDAHLHLRGIGTAAREIDLNGTVSAEQVAGRVREAAAAVPAGSWLRGRGWDQNDWQEQSFPTHGLLDVAAPDHPVWLSRVDGHAVWLNARGLALSGITEATPDPQGGEIVRDASGRPTGVLVDNAISLAEAQLPEPTPQEIRADYLRGAELCARVGLTAVHDMGVSVAELEQLRALEAAGQLDLRVWVYLSGDLDEVLPVLADPAVTDGLVRVAGVKLFADGALGSRGAALLLPYDDRPDTSGLLLTAPDELARQARAVHESGRQVAIHAIGDRGNRIALDAIEQAEGADHTRLHRIEHAQIVSPEDLPRFSRLGVVASMQPTHATSDMPWAQARVGAARLGGGYAWRSMIDSGALVVFGSDAPVESENPWFGIHAAVTRQDQSGNPEGGFFPAERVTLEEAIVGFTAAPARAVGFDGGALREGASADVTIVSEDPFAMAPEQIHAVHTLRTVVAGREVYVSRAP